MKSTFKKNLFVTMAMFTVVTAKAEPTREFPYVAPFYCPNSIVQRPEGASPFYRSETCKTVFVLPPQMGTIEYRINTASANDADCDDLKTMRKDKRLLYDRYKKIQEAAAKDGVSVERLAIYERQMELLKNSMNDLEHAMVKLSGTEGARMDVKLASNFSEEVNRYQMANQLLFAQGTRFENAPIAESYVSFDSGEKEAKDTRPAVIRTSIPSIQVRGVESAPGSDSRIMNGSLSGTVYLGLNAICNMRDQQGATSIGKTDFSAANLEAFIPANLTYSVPVLSSYSYEASLDYKMVVEDLFKQWELRPDQFTVNAIKNQLISAEGSNKISWKFTAYELQDRGLTSTDLKEIEAREKEAVFADWARQIADVLVQMEILKREAPIAIPAPPAGSVAETYYREVCQSKSFLGVRYSHRCWEEPYTVVRVRAGEANNVIEKLTRLNMKFEEKVSYSQPIFRTHTSTFHYVTKR